MAVNKAETFIRAPLYINLLRRRPRNCLLHVMELWASGFNAWNQLQFDGEVPAQPRDLHEFMPVLGGEKIEVLRTSLSATLGKFLDFVSLKSLELA